MAAKSDLPNSNMSVATEPAVRKPKKLTSVPTTSSHGDDSKFDRLVYERVRLGIMSALAVREELTFSELKTLFDVSDGNLSAHARKLEEAHYLSCTKSLKTGGRRRFIDSPHSEKPPSIVTLITSKP